MPTLLLVVILLLSIASIVKSESEEPWQECYIFLAPSPTGYGVYAAKDFRQGEVLDFTPLLVPMTAFPESKLIKTSVLDEYVYGYMRRSGEYTSAVLFGYDMMYNHHPNPNIALNGFYTSLSFVAKRNIKAGEQLYASYGTEDGGKTWFGQRGLTMLLPTKFGISPQSLPYFKEEFCSRIYAGHGMPSVEKYKAEFGPSGPPIDESRLAPFNAGLGDARAKQSIKKGERVELAPGLLLSRRAFQGSALAPLLFFWEDLEESHRTAIRILQETGRLILQYQGYDTGWERVERFAGFEDLSILPCGRIAMIRRVGAKETANCRLNIAWQGAPESVSVTLEVVATADIKAGEVLLLDLPPAGTPAELQLLKLELLETGHAFNEEIFSRKEGDDNLVGEL